MRLRVRDMDTKPEFERTWVASLRDWRGSGEHIGREEHEGDGGDWGCHCCSSEK